MEWGLDSLHLEPAKKKKKVFIQIIYINQHRDVRHREGQIEQE